MEISNIAVLLGTACVFAAVASRFKQPLLIGYLIAGMILSYFGYISNAHFLEVSSQIGVTLLLFLVGMEMNVGQLPSLGKVALLTGAGQILFTSTIGFVISLLLGFAILPSIYIAVALTFSSTIIMMKLLSEKNDLGSLYGRIAVGFLLVQDVVAMLILMFLSGVKTGNFGSFSFVFLILKALILLIIVYVLSRFVLPWVVDKVMTDSSELLFVFSIAWALVFAVFVSDGLGFTLEIGGFLAGLSLSTLPEHLQIASRTRPLRDFFLTIFFLFLGTKLVIGGVGEILLPALILSAFVLIGNPIIVLAIMGFLGYRKRTSFLAGLTVAQISEFSLILMAMGLSLGHLGESEVGLVVLVGVITMTISTYMIMSGEKLYTRFVPVLSLFERQNTKEIRLGKKKDYKNHVVLVGGDRTGQQIIPVLQKNETEFVVVDFNPQVFNRLYAQNIPVVFGDISDPDIMEEVNLESAKLVVSTSPSLADNLVLLQGLKDQKSKAASIFVDHDRQKAAELYRLGASLVVNPELAAGDYIASVLRKTGLNKKQIVQLAK